MESSQPRSCVSFCWALLAKIKAFWTCDFFWRSLCCSWTCSRLHSRSLVFSGCITHTVMSRTVWSHLPGAHGAQRLANSDFKPGRGGWSVTVSISSQTNQPLKLSKVIIHILAIGSSLLFTHCLDNIATTRMPHRLFNSLWLIMLIQKLDRTTVGSRLLDIKMMVTQLRSQFGPWRKGPKLIFCEAWISLGYINFIPWAFESWMSRGRCSHCNHHPLAACQGQDLST